MRTLKALSRNQSRFSREKLCQRQPSYPATHPSKRAACRLFTRAAEPWYRHLSQSVDRFLRLNKNPTQERDRPPQELVLCLLQSTCLSVHERVQTTVLLAEDHPLLRPPIATTVPLSSADRLRPHDVLLRPVEGPNSLRRLLGPKTQSARLPGSLSLTVTAEVRSPPREIIFPEVLVGNLRQLVEETNLLLHTRPLFVANGPARLGLFCRFLALVTIATISTSLDDRLLATPTSFEMRAACDHSMNDTSLLVVPSTRLAGNAPVRPCDQRLSHAIQETALILIDDLFLEGRSALLDPIVVRHHLACASLIRSRCDAVAHRLRPGLTLHSLGQPEATTFLLSIAIHTSEDPLSPAIATTERRTRSEDP